MAELGERSEPLKHGRLRDPLGIERGIAGGRLRRRQVRGSQSMVGDKIAVKIEAGAGVGELLSGSLSAGDGIDVNGTSDEFAEEWEGVITGQLSGLVRGEETDAGGAVGDQLLEAGELILAGEQFVFGDEDDDVAGSNGAFEFV